MKPVKKDTNRIAKVNSLVQAALGPILLEFFYEQKYLVTITKVDTSRDMKWAKVWISIFNPTSKPSQEELLAASKPGDKSLTDFDKKILDNLNKNIYHLQGELNKNFATKIIPKISFHLDVTPRYVQRIDEVIREIHEDQN